MAVLLLFCGFLWCVPLLTFLFAPNSDPDAWQPPWTTRNIGGVGNVLLEGSRFRNSPPDVLELLASYQPNRIQTLRHLSVLGLLSLVVIFPPTVRSKNCLTLVVRSPVSLRCMAFSKLRAVQLSFP
jgi:hypothetical protein